MTLTVDLNRVHPLTMFNISASFDGESHIGLVSTVFTGVAHTHTDEELLYPIRNALHWDQKDMVLVLVVTQGTGLRYYIQSRSMDVRRVDVLYSRSELYFDDII